MKSIASKLRASLTKRYNLLFHEGYSVERAYGCKFLIDWEHPVDKKLAFERFEDKRIRYFLKCIDRIRPDVFLDIGAHAGLYSILVIHQQPGIEVHAFEPDSTNRGQLAANLFLNRLTTSVTVHPIGLSKEAGFLRFASSSEHRHRAFSRISEEGGVSVEVRPLDEVVDLIDRTIALKIDVEGHELPALNGAKTTLLRNRCYLQVESSEEHFPRVCELLESMGYRWLTSQGDHYFTNIPEFNA